MNRDTGLPYAGGDVELAGIGTFDVGLLDLDGSVPGVEQLFLFQPALKSG